MKAKERKQVLYTAFDSLDDEHLVPSSARSGGTADGR